MLERCPVCEANLDSNLECAKCGFKFEEPTPPKKWLRKIILLVAVTAVLSALVLAAFFLAPDKPVLVDGHYRVTGVNGGKSYVPVEHYERWRSLHSQLDRLRKTLRAQKREKLDKYGDLEEERRLERLITITANQIEVIILEIAALEKSELSSEPSPVSSPMSS
ncbi:MAG: hypothetical protein Kow00107_01540 [Planctomycetota bacterium]